MTAEPFLREIAKGTFSSLYLFRGKEEHLIEEAQEALKQAFFKEEPPDAFGLLIIHGEEVDEKALKDELRSPPMMGSRKMVVIKKADRLRKGAARTIADLIPNLPPSLCLTLLAPNLESGSDLLSLAEKHGKVVTFNPIKGEALIKWVQKTLEKKGKSLSHPLAEKVVEIYGQELAFLAGELQSLADFMGSRREVKEKDLLALSGYRQKSTIFQLPDAVALRNITQALQHLLRLRQEGREETYLLFMIEMQLKKMLRAKRLLEERISEEEVARQLNIKYYKDKFFNGLNNYTLKELRTALDEVLLTDVKLKSSLGEEGLNLEMLLIKVCHG